MTQIYVKVLLSIRLNIETDEYFCAMQFTELDALTDYIWISIL
jgi:hypothetical protein